MDLDGGQGNGIPVPRIFMGRLAKKLGCKERLDAKPFEEFFPHN